MLHPDKIIKKMTDAVQERCAERLELAAQNSKNVHKPHDAIDNYGISSNLKRKRGLL
jgi:hypothetical protein